MKTGKIKLNKNYGKTRSIRYKFLVTLILAMLAITIFIGGLSIYEVDNYIQEQSNNYVNITCVNEAEQINNSLKNMEKSVKIMESYVIDFFNSEEDVENHEIQEKVVKSADLMFKDVTKHTSTAGAVSYYFRLDPTISNSKAGLFYSKLKGSEEFVSLEPTDISAFDKSDVERVGWFWQPYEAQKPVWMKPYHNQNNDILMISYVIPMYYGEKFVGVVGMDFDYITLEKQVQGIKIYDNGFAYLEMDGVVISNGKFYPDSEDYLSVSKELANGMSLVLSASYDDIRQIRYEIALKILLIVIVLFVFFTSIAAYVVRKISEPLIKLTKTASVLADGNYDVEIKQSDTHEIEMLNVAFENMAAKLREREELLRLLANRDSMTGLRNTTSYLEWVSQFDKQIEKEKIDFGIIMLDLNDLKKTNDVYGHETGNELIITSAKIISDVFKRSPVFRIGGDEFVVILLNDDLEKHNELLETFKSRCENTYVEGKHYPINIAVGFSRFEQGKDFQFADVFNRADNAMYENKRNMKSQA